MVLEPGAGESGRLVRWRPSADFAVVLLQATMPVTATQLDVNPVTDAVLLTRYQSSSDDIVVLPLASSGLGED